MAGKPWSEDELLYLQGHYGRVPVKRIAKQLHRTYEAVQHKAQALQLTSKRPSRQPWTQQEEDYILRHYETKGAEYVAKHLNRSLNSVKRKADRLRLYSYGLETVSLRALASCFHSDPSVVHRWITLGLPHKKTKRGQLYVYKFDQTKFWKWAYTHQTCIPWNKYEPYSLLPEPTWLTETLLSYTKTKHRMPITAYDIQQVIYLRTNGASWRTISDQTGRSLDAVKHIWRTHQKERKH